MYVQRELKLTIELHAHTSCILKHTCIHTHMYTHTHTHTHHIHLYMYIYNVHMYILSLLLLAAVNYSTLITHHMDKVHLGRRGREVDLGRQPVVNLRYQRSVTPPTCSDDGLTPPSVMRVMSS